MPDRQPPPPLPPRRRSPKRRWAHRPRPTTDAGWMSRLMRPRLSEQEAVDVSPPSAVPRRSSWTALWWCRRPHARIAPPAQRCRPVRGDHAEGQGSGADREPVRDFRPRLRGGDPNHLSGRPTEREAEEIRGGWRDTADVDVGYEETSWRAWMGRCLCAIGPDASSCPREWSTIRPFWQMIRPPRMTKSSEPWTRQPSKGV